MSPTVKKSSTKPIYPAPTYRRVIMMRHGERIDEVDRNWAEKGFKSGEYKRCNLNMPLTAPSRSMVSFESKLSWEGDSGLSVYGHWSAQIMGLRLSKLSVKIDQIYSSPAIRCVQTASRIMEAYKSRDSSFNVKMHIEDGLYEWGFGVGWAVPPFVPSKMLKDSGLPIECDYKPAVPCEDIMPDESIEDFNKRCSTVIKQIVGRLGKECTALVVTHAPWFDGFNRYLNKPMKKPNDYMKRVELTPHLFMNVYDEVGPSKWNAVKPPILSFRHDKNNEFSYELYDQFKQIL